MNIQQEKAQQQKAQQVNALKKALKKALKTARKKALKKKHSRPARQNRNWRVDGKAFISEKSELSGLSFLCD